MAFYITETLEIINDWRMRYPGAGKWKGSPTKKAIMRELRNISRDNGDELLKDKKVCRCCAKSLEDNNFDLDHIMSVTEAQGKYGPEWAKVWISKENLQLLCKECHCRKTERERLRYGWKKS